MQRSLFSGVTGLTNHQLILDTTANNLANVSTYGFKGSRVSFATALNQTQSAGTAPNGGLGGTNPRQIGLGVTNSSVDVDMRQGSLLSTGRSLDLAIQGGGFFTVTDGTQTFYSRVGNFGVDGTKTMVDLGSGNQVMGVTYDADGNASQVGAINLGRAQALESRVTQEVFMQGNLNADTPALQSDEISSLFPLTVTSTGASASQDVRLSDLTIFRGGNEPVTPATQVRQMHLFGTKPDGSSWSAAIQVNPWNDTVGDLVNKINATLVNGNTRFGLASLSGGNIVAEGVGVGTGFSIYMGDAAASEVTTEAGALTDAVGVAYNAVPGNLMPSTNPSANGRLAPTFIMPAVDLSGPANAGKTLTITVNVNGSPAGTVTIPAADYSDPDVSRTFTLANMPNVTTTSNVTFDIAGDLDTGVNTVTWTTDIVDQTRIADMIADDNADGIVNMYDPLQTGVDYDANAWQYDRNSNSNFSWYRSRFVPTQDLVKSTIEVYDSLGSRHTVESRMFRTGSKPDPSNPAAVRNTWDMITAFEHGDGDIIDVNGIDDFDDVVAGIEFDQDGKFTGDIGTTTKGTALDKAIYVGDPQSDTVRIDWDTTGVTPEQDIKMNFGTAGGVDGLTGFGSSSTASLISQNGYGSGQLSNLSVTAGGDIVGLYSNGISQRIAALSMTEFANPAGLINNGGNLYAASSNSGNAIARSAGEGGVGVITAGALEGSNVDIASEFTRLITAQRGFQVNARVIQTTDSVLQELAGLIR